MVGRPCFSAKASERVGRMQAVSQGEFKPDYRFWLPLSACAAILLAWHLWAYFTFTTLIFALLLCTIMIYALFHCPKGIRLDEDKQEIEIYNPLFGIRLRFPMEQIKNYRPRGVVIRSFSFEIESGTTFQFYQIGTAKFAELQERMKTLSLRNDGEEKKDQRLYGKRKG